jgi:ABC-2 type transport system ATP-binding protein
VRALAGHGKAVLISSHILTELSEICDGVAIIEQGKIRATGSVEEILRGLSPHRQVFVRCLTDAGVLERALAETPGVERPRPERGGVLFDFQGGEDELARLLAGLVQRGLALVEFAPERADLEDLFLTLTEGNLQ